MFAVQAVYDGKTFHAQETIPVTHPYDVVITFVKPRQSEGSPLDDKERLRIVESLFGVLPATVTDGEIKEERLKRYAGAR